MKIVLNLEIADGVFDSCVEDVNEVAMVIERAVRKAVCRKLRLSAEVIEVKRSNKNTDEKE